MTKATKGATGRLCWILLGGITLVSCAPSGASSNAANHQERAFHFQYKAVLVQRLLYFTPGQ